MTLPKNKLIFRKWAGTIGLLMHITFLYFVLFELKEFAGISSWKEWVSAISDFIWFASTFVALAVMLSSKTRTKIFSKISLGALGAVLLLTIILFTVPKDLFKVETNQLVYIMGFSWFCIFLFIMIFDIFVKDESWEDMTKYVWFLWALNMLLVISFYSVVVVLGQLGLFTIIFIAGALFFYPIIKRLRKEDRLKGEAAQEEN